MIELKYGVALVVALALLLALYYQSGTPFSISEVKRQQEARNELIAKLIQEDEYVNKVINSILALYEVDYEVKVASPYGVLSKEEIRSILIREAEAHIGLTFVVDDD